MHLGPGAPRAQRHQRGAETPERRRDTRDTQRHQRGAETPETHIDTREAQRDAKDLRNFRLSDFQTFRLSDETSDFQTFRLSDETSDFQTFRLSDFQTFRLTRDFGLSARALGGVGVALVRPSSACAREARRLARIGRARRPRARTLAPGSLAPGAPGGAPARFAPANLVGNTRSDQLRRHLRAWLYLHFCCI